MHETERHTPARLYDARRDELKTPEEVTAMARLKSLGCEIRDGARITHYRVV